MRLLLRTRVQLTRRAVRQGCHFFVVPQRNGERKGTQGPNALGKPATRKVVPLSLHSFFRESKHLQLLRARLKESRTHGSCSDFAFAKDVSFCLVPCDRRKFKQDGKAKAFALRTHLGRALMRPRWRKLARATAPTAMRGRRDGGRPRRERPGFLLGYFLGNAKK